MSRGKINWPGASGKSYEYEIYENETTFRSVPGNYVFAREVTPGHWAPVYIGETGDLSTRFDDHHKAKEIAKHGATHICVHASSSNKQQRLNEETDLVRKWAPPCNG
jgi:hypothetical protein